MNIEKIKIKDNCYVWVDKDAEIKEGNHLCSWELGLTNNPKWKIYQSRNPKFERLVDKTYKIIAASPELELEGIPDYVEWLAKEYAENWEEIHPELNSDDISPENVSKIDFRAGYEKAEQEMFTEDDMKKAIELARLREHIMGLFIYEPEQIIEQIKSE